MGNWHISIRGMGFHHNGDRIPEDANRMAANFVRELQKANHMILGADFTSGGNDDLLAQVEAERDEPGK